MKTPHFLLTSLITFLLISSEALAEEAAAAAINSGDTAWILISTGLVMLMTPALGFFYGGMVRTKHVVSTIYQSIIALGMGAMLWFAIGYSLSFSDGNSFIGGFGMSFLTGISVDAKAGTTIPHILFVLFQGTFAVITPALVTGAFAERISFKAWLIILVLWSFLIYYPVCHWVWGPGGWIAAHGGLDFAGGLVVHTTAGISALVCAITFGRRSDFGVSKERPYDTGFIILGTALLWFGWFGFNGGSALAANGLAAHACATTFFAAAAAMAAWTFVDWLKNGKPSAIGTCIGTVVGLVGITPGAGFVSVQSAVIIGIFCAIGSNVSVEFFRHRLKLDDTLDVFACHGIGGIIGALLTGVFASKGINPAGADGLIYGNMAPFIANLKGVVVVSLYTAGMTYAILKLTNVIAKIRVSFHDETRGLDSSQHDELINANIVAKYGEREAQVITKHV